MEKYKWYLKLNLVNSILSIPIINVVIKIKERWWWERPTKDGERRWEMGRGWGREWEIDYIKEMNNKD